MALIYVLTDNQRAQQAATELMQLGHQAACFMTYDQLRKIAFDYWADYIIALAESDADLGAWTEFASSFSKFRDRTGCNTEMCAAVPRISELTGYTMDAVRSMCLVEENGVTLPGFIQFQEQLRAMRSCSGISITSRHGFFGTRNALCDDKELLLSANFRVGMRPFVPDISGEQLAIVDLFIRFGPTLSLDSIHDILNRNDFYEKQLKRSVARRGLRMMISNVNSRVGRSLWRGSYFQLLKSLQGRTGHYTLNGTGFCTHVKLD